MTMIHIHFRFYIHIYIYIHGPPISFISRSVSSQSADMKCMTEVPSSVSTFKRKEKQ